jgi:hypothetical protein
VMRLDTRRGCAVRHGPLDGEPYVRQALVVSDLPIYGACRESARAACQPE